MIIAPNISNVIGVFTMGFGIMASVLTNNVSALAALANGLLPLRKLSQQPSTRSPSTHALGDIVDKNTLARAPYPRSQLIELGLEIRRTTQVTA